MSDGNFLTSDEVLVSGLLQIKAEIGRHDTEGERLRRQRDGLIVRCNKAGWTEREIAKQVGISNVRVHQILARECDSTSTP